MLIFEQLNVPFRNKTIPQFTCPSHWSWFGK